MFNMSSSEFLIKSKHISASFIKDAARQKAFDDNADSFVSYVESVNAQMIFASVVDTKALTLINDTSHLLLGDDNDDNNLENALNKSDFYLVGYVPVADISFHAEKLLWRSIFFTLDFFLFLPLSWPMLRVLPLLSIFNVSIEHPLCRDG